MLRLSQVAHGDQRMGLAAAERGLQLYHRVATEARQAPDDLVQQQGHALSDKGPGEELAGVLVLGGRLALLHLGDVRRELGLLEGAFQHILVGDGNVAPRFDHRAAPSISTTDQWVREFRMSMPPASG